MPKGEYLQYGGQAIIEGVMMRSPRFFSVACRAPNGQIVLKTEAIEKTWIGRQKWLKLPFLRGALAILDSMALGLRSMRFASNVQLEEDFQEGKPGRPAEEIPPEDKAEPVEKPKTAAAAGSSAKMQDGLILGTMIASVLIGLFIFQYLPNLISAGIAGNRTFTGIYEMPKDKTVQQVQNKLDDAGLRDVKVAQEGGNLKITLSPNNDIKDLKAPEAATKVAEIAGISSAPVSSDQKGLPDWRINLVTEVIKILFFVGYVWLISRLPEIQRVFQYHGAEHKAINTLEASQELNLENCKAQTRLHPRCGTSFAVIVLLVSLIFFTFVPRPQYYWLLNSLVRFLIEVPLLLIVAGVSYELIRIAGKFRNQKWVGYLFWPGLMTQYITTSEPDAEQIEVALESLKATIAAEDSGSAEAETRVMGEPKPAAT